MSIFEVCEFEIDQYEIAAYSTYLVGEYKKIAYVYDMELNSYVTNILGQDINSFYQYCYEYGEYEIKRYLVIGAIFNDMGFVINDDEYKEMCRAVGYDYDCFGVFFGCFVCLYCSDNEPYFFKRKQCRV